MDADVPLLLTSEVGGEGIDLQKASVVINYDLPWNPMVLEQRIGRVDRIGQESPVIYIFNFVVEHSVEEKILGRLTMIDISGRVRQLLSVRNTRLIRLFYSN